MTITIECPPAVLWETLTTPALMAQWMGEEMAITVSTSWELHSPILIRGFHHHAFENRGIILAFEKERKLSYTHLSNLSGLADEPGNYTILTFHLTPVAEGTTLSISIENFPDDIIQKHLEFYWRGTLFKIRAFIYSRTSGDTAGSSYT